MANKVLNTRIQLKYDTLANWNSSNFIPLAGEVCIAIIPNGNTNSAENPNAAYQVFEPNRYPNNDTTQNLSGLSPYAIGMKVGDGVRTFTQLPWTQAIAGDVYNWAKAATKPTYIGSEINATRKDSTAPNNQTLWTTPTVEAWLQSLTDDINSLSGGNGSISTQIANAITALDVDNLTSSDEGYDENKSHITGFGEGKTLATLTETDGKIAATFQDIQITKDKVTNAGTAIGADIATTSINDNDNGTELTTKAQVAAYVARKVAGLTGAMHFIGVSTSAITDGGIENPTINGNQVSTKAQGDVVLYNNGTNISQEYVWTGTAWELLGDEGSYAVKGSITKNDLDSSLSSEIEGKLDTTDAQSTYVAKNGTDRLITETEANKLSGIANGAQVNVIEKIQVPGNTSGSFTDLSITNKTVQLAKIAETGNVNDLIQTEGDFIIFNCGDSKTFITNPS